MARAVRLLCAALVLGGLYPRSGQADVGRGADVFDENCAECHSLAVPPRNKKGPSLVGIVGRPSAQIPGFNYSDAMKALATTWTPEELDTYLTAPRKLVPGGKMKFDGLDSPRERADLIDFLETRK